VALLDFPPEFPRNHQRHAEFASVSESATIREPPDRHDQHLVGPDLPARRWLLRPVAVERRHQEHLESGIVVHGDAAIDEDELLISFVLSGFGSTITSGGK
jgi:hypothetical protein